ncbi:helix-turn-helix domain-containing protein [uncultured Methylobacterium sp.]|uniref:helix-turn-helix domain-containing protein n=1 Tax=Methylobacterium ajmalii TaxID=2738439 RepID=UPI00338F4643
MQGCSRARGCCSKCGEKGEFQPAPPHRDRARPAPGLGHHHRGGAGCVTPRASQTLVAELGLRELAGRERFRAWGIL